MSKTKITNDFGVPDYYANKAKRMLNFADEIHKIEVTKDKRILVTYVFNGGLYSAEIAGTGYEY